MTVADRLGKTDTEIMEMSVEQFARWIAYINLDAEEKAKAYEKSSTTPQVDAEFNRRVARQSRSR